MSELTFQESISIDATPRQIYDLVSDISRTGEWSPICQRCAWEDESVTVPEVGAWFSGHNRSGEREWDTRSQVTAADPGEKFSWQVGGVWVYWAYTMAPEGTGTRLTESWEFLPEGVAMFKENFGDKAEEQIEVRKHDALAGIPQTLAAIKRIAEEQN